MRRVRVDVDEAARRHVEGEGIKSIATALGVCSSTIYSRLRAAGVETRSLSEAALLRHDPGLTSTQKREEVPTRYLNGETQESIADSLSVSSKYIRKLLGEANIELRTRGEAQYYRFESSPLAAQKRRIEKRLARVGWTYERWAALMYAQGGLCYICGESNYSRGTMKRLDSDHSHLSGAPRGLLCSYCNTRIVVLLEDQAIWEAVGRYLGHI